MSFISLNFVTLFVCTFLLYYTLPPKYRKAILLLSSCVFIGYYHIAFLIIALLISLATFFLGKWVGQSKHEKDAKRIYISGLCFLITGTKGPERYKRRCLRGIASVRLAGGWHIGMPTSL